ncbi:MAG: hypothetical protein WD773_08420 [Gemmatimonadales bacterium]
MLRVLLFIQVFGGGAITLAHARDVVTAPPGIEASHDGRCAILHDELRCALCHYAGARVVVHQTLVTAVPPVARVQPLRTPPVVAVASAVRLSAPARAPPLPLS